MAKDRRKVQHIHSSVPDKQPTPASLEVGEIAVNNSKNQEFLSIKNSEDKVVRFSSDEQMITIVERKEVMPYEGLVRGAEGPGGTKDSYNSYGITENDLRNNKSNLIIKLNQVAAGNTTKHDKVNGAKDIYNNLVNPTTDGGLNDGAGFAIDMSRYAMNGANPSFSSMTTTCHTELNGRTEILGGNGTTGDCRSYLKIDVLTADTKVTSAKTGIVSATTIIGKNDTTISGDTMLKVSGATTETKKGNVTETNLANKTENTSGNSTVNVNGNYVGRTTGTTTETKIGNVVESHSGTTTEFKKGDITENNLANKTENTSGNYGVKTTGTTTETKIGNVTESHSGTTTETKQGKVIETNLSDKVESTSGNSYNDVKLNYSGTTGGTTTEVHQGNVTITNNSNKTENVKQNYNVNVTGNTTVTTTGNTTITTSGTTNINSAGKTTVKSCSGVEINTNDFKVKQCSGTNGSAEMEFCGGYNIKSNNVEINQCSDNGKFTINEETVTVNAGDTTINDSGNTTVMTSGNTAIHSNGAVGITANGDITAISSESNIFITANKNLCATAGDNATIYGEDVTNVGTNCNGAGASTNTNISGGTIGISASTLNEKVTGNEAVNIGGNYITNVTGNTQMFSTGKTCINSTGNLNIGSDANTNIGINCNDGVYSNNVNISATSSINESATTVNVKGSSTINIEAPTTNVTGNTTLNLKGNTVNVSANTYSSYTTSKTCILANTDLNIGGNSNTKIGVDCNGSVYSDNTFIDASSSVTINAPVTNITGDTNISGDTIIKGDTIIDGKLIISGTGLSTKLSWTYDNVCNATGDSTNFKADKSFKIPSSVAHIKRETLSWSYGSVSGKTAGAYDPGSNTSSNCTQNSDTSKITIPKSIDHLDEWNGTCFMIPHNLCVSGTVTSTGGMYTSSDEVLKDDIHYIRGEEISRARKVELKSFYYKSDPSRRKVYGVIAQDVERLGLNELVHYDENGIRSVDYTGLLLLKIAALEKEISILKNKFDEQK